MWRKWLVLIAGLALLGLVNASIVQRERLIEDGRVVLLELAPVDPRSLMQGDYMALRFKVANEISNAQRDKDKQDGHVVLKLDDKGVGTYRRIDAGAALQPGELRMRYRVRNDHIKFGTNAFFFQEGHAQRYEPAKFGEFRVAESGEAILVGLRDIHLKKLGDATPAVK